MSAGRARGTPDSATVSKSQAIRDGVVEMLPVAATNSAVLLLGQAGVGKELFAEAIHDASPRRHRAMVRVNAAAIPAALIEREMFGYLEEANGSTLFLDEVGDLPPDVQAKLLRVLDEGTFDVRLIATTNHNVDDALRDGRLREDLFCRLNEFPIWIAPVAERRAATPEGAREQYSWRGDLRELRNVIERTMLVARSSRLAPWHQLTWSVSFNGSTQRYSVHAV